MTTQKTSEKDFGRIDFVRLAPLMGVLSLIATVVALCFIIFKGFNYGIDFSGGTEIQVKFAAPVELSAVRAKVEAAGVKEFTVQNFGDGNEYLIRIDNPKDITNEDQIAKRVAAQVSGIKNSVAELNLAPEGIRRVDTVGPSVGAELKKNGMLAAFYCFLVIMIYVAIRFDYKYAPGAVLCLVHDTIITLGIFSMLGKEVNTQIMAAVLTLIGYSLNDTIVNYDRIRETAPLYKNRTTSYIINKAVNDVLGRTMLTAAATMIACVALYIWGGGVIEEIAFTLIIGILIGTFSSVYVAAPFILLMEKLGRKQI